MTAIGALFALLRGSLSYREFARAVGSSHSHLYRVERGCKQPSIKLVKAVGAWAGCSTRQVELLLLCRHAPVDVEMALASWPARTALGLQIADALVRGLSCPPEDAFVHADAAVTSVVEAERRKLFANIDRAQLDLLGAQS